MKINYTQEQITQISKDLKSLGFSNWNFCKENNNYVAIDSGHILRVRTNQKSKTGNLIIKHSTKLLNGSEDKYGYRTIRMMVDGKKRHIKAHRLVANAFIPNPENKSEVNHINGIKLDNRVSNLEWNTRTENNRHAINTGLLGVGNKSKHTKIFTWDYVTIYSLQVNCGYEVQEIADMYNVSKAPIEKVLRRMKPFMKSLIQKIEENNA